MLKKFPLMPYLLSFLSKMLWFTLSNALAKSKNIVQLERRLSKFDRSFSYISMIAKSVLNFLRKPNWHSDNNLYLSRKSVSLEEISFSNSFPIQGSKEMGLYEFKLCLSPPLNRGVTLASLKHSGNTPFDKQILNNFTGNGAMIKLVSFSTRFDIRS